MTRAPVQECRRRINFSGRRMAYGSRLGVLVHPISHCQLFHISDRERLGRAALDKICRWAKLAWTADEPIAISDASKACRRHADARDVDIGHRCLAENNTKPIKSGSAHFPASSHAHQGQALCVGSRALTRMRTSHLSGTEPEAKTTT
jgi:hypothetical protein